MSHPGFAVIDLETTGLFAGGSHRIIEIAIVHVSADGEITGAWETLVNPQRDLGPQHIHGVSASDVMHAPTFVDVAPEVVELLNGRILVAHNAQFDIGFLQAEFDRIGVWFSVNALCTMRLARQFLPGAGRSLADCCDAYEIALENAHRASVDAFATAQLLSAYLADHPDWPDWRDLQRAAALEALAPTGVTTVARRSAAERSASFLQRITEKLPEFAGPDDHLDYLALLDRCLIDRHISEHEAASLVEYAESRGIGRATCEALHAEYFDQLANIAWADGILTGEERHDLASVGTALGLGRDVIEAANEYREVSALPVSAFALAVGDLIVLTGEMNRSRDDWHNDLTARGYVPWAGVTKKVKLLVAADPDSLSGKARKARDYGIPVVGEAGLESLLATGIR